MERLQLLSSQLGDYQLLNNNEASFHCPNCGHRKKKLQVNLTTGKYHCWVCDFRGNSIYSLFKKIEAPKGILDQVKDSHTPKEVERHYEVIYMLPTEFKPLSSGETPFEKKRALNYLKPRNIGEEKIIRYNLYYCEEGKYKNRIIIPSYDENFNLTTYTSRLYWGEGLKYLMPSYDKDNIIFFEHLINWNEDLILLEGPFDGIEVENNSVPLLGKKINTAIKKKLINFTKNIFIALDPDAVKDAIDIKKYFNERGINAEIVYMKKDPADSGKEDVMERIEKRFFYTDMEIKKIELGL